MYSNNNKKAVTNQPDGIFLSTFKRLIDIDGFTYALPSMHAGDSIEIDASEPKTKMSKIKRGKTS